ncbi:hypothetical protein [Pseudoduganella violaceinigra]|uniref:hypothetical protein n=1 Tax=Pseudoduganella violaceinigra TaxID=246602 RepID=UPI00040F35D9|nr:hypothetical protein [Pseudoduganella violaceinigra]
MRTTLALASLGLAAALWRSGAGIAPPAPAPAASRATGANAPMPREQATPPAAAPPAASAAVGIASVEARVHDARRQGKGEQEVHRLRAASLTAQQMEALARMEAAEADWRRRVAALQAACAGNADCGQARAAFTQEELARVAAYSAPTLRQ